MRHSSKVKTNISSSKWRMHFQTSKTLLDERKCNRNHYNINEKLITNLVIQTESLFNFGKITLRLALPIQLINSQYLYQFSLFLINHTTSLNSTNLNKSK